MLWSRWEASLGDILVDPGCGCDPGTRQFAPELRVGRDKKIETDEAEAVKNKWNFESY